MSFSRTLATGFLVTLLLGFAISVANGNVVNDVPKEAAAAAFQAHGGQRFAAVSSIAVTGSVDVTVSAFQQAIPATFATILQGEKYLLEVNASVASFRQSFDGTNTFTAPDRGFSLPPLNRIGLALLQRMNVEGYTVSEAQDKGGFRITSPEGYYTDFYLSKKTSLVKSYEASYLVAGREVTTKVEVKDYEVSDGIAIPSRYDQRFDLAGLTVYAAFKSKEIVVNKEAPAGVFGPAGNSSGK